MDDTVSLTLAHDKLFSSARDLQTRMDSVLLNEFYDSTDLIYRAYVWLLFSGMKMDDAINVQKHNVVFQHGVYVVKCKQDQYQIDKYGSNAIERAMHLCSFECFAESETGLIRRNISRPDSEYLIAGINGKIGKDAIGVMLSRKASEAGKNLDRKSIYYSGIFLRAFQLQQLKPHEQNVIYRYNKDFDEWKRMVTCGRTFENSTAD